MSDSIGVRAESCTSAGRVTRSLLGYGVLAGPFYVAVVVAQAFVRPGFDIVRHDASLLSNGSLGWIQVANFLLTGAMVLAFAAGLARALSSGRGATWAPRLIAAYGVGLVGAGIFVADPMNGFPAGAPAGHPATISAHGMLHIVFAAGGFICLIAACVVMARRFAGDGRRDLAALSIAAGVGFLAGFIGVASGSASPIVVIGFEVALILVWSWMAAIAVHFYRRVA